MAKYDFFDKTPYELLFTSIDLINYVDEETYKKLKDKDLGTVELVRRNDELHLITPDNIFDVAFFRDVPKEENIKNFEEWLKIYLKVNKIIN